VPKEGPSGEPEPTESEQGPEPPPESGPGDSGETSTPADAIGNIRNRLDRLSDELTAWDQVGRATAFEDELAGS
jgi:hypothetical protein